MKAFTPEAPIRLYDLLSVKAENSKIAIAKELFELKTNYSDAKCEALFDILAKTTDQLGISTVDVADMLTGTEAFKFWPQIMEYSQMSLKDAAEDEKLASVSKFNSCAHAIYVPVCKALGGEFTCQTPELKEFKNTAEELNAFILLGDTLAVIEKKIQKAFCPEKEDCGVLQHFSLVERLSGPITIGEHKFTYSELRAAFLDGEIGPKELKETLLEFYTQYAVDDEDFYKKCQEVWKLK